MLTTILIALIRVYQMTLSRLLLAAFGPMYRFEPSCSRYAMACLQGQGALRGTLLSVRRLCKCHPFHPGGYDPPPPPRRASAHRSGHFSADHSARTDGPPVHGAEVGSSCGTPESVPRSSCGTPVPRLVTLGAPPPVPNSPAAAPATPDFSTTTRPETAA